MPDINPHLPISLHHAQLSPQFQQTTIQPLHPSTSETLLTDHIQEASTSSLYPPIRSIYITAPNPFPTLDQFVLDTAKGYNIDLHHFGGGMKAALKAYLGCQGGEGVSAMLMGTRRSDPNGGESSSLPASVLWAVRHRADIRCANSSTNRSFLAKITPYTPTPRLVLRRNMGLPPRTRRTILRAIRRGIYKSRKYTQHDTESMSSIGWTREMGTCMEM
jgi:hypothetical protein